MSIDTKRIKELFEKPDSFQISGDNLNFPFHCYFVGGRLENIRDVILPSLKKELGMNLTMIGHKDPTKKTFPSIPITTMIIFHLKDMSGHAIREWAKKEADDVGIPFIEIVQKIKPAMETLEKHYPNFWLISQRFKMLRALLPAEECKKEESFPIITVESFVHSLTQKEDWQIIEKACIDKPYKIMPVNVNNEKFVGFYRQSIKENIPYFVSGMNINQDNASESEEKIPARLEEWYKKCGDCLADYVISVIQGKTNRYSKEQLIEIKRHWLIDMITDPSLGKEWTQNFHKIDLAFKGVFGCGIPSILKNEVKEMLEMKYQDDYKGLISEEVLDLEKIVIPLEIDKPEPVQTEPLQIIEEPLQLIEEPIKQTEMLESIKPIEKETTMEKKPLSNLEETKLLKSAGINGMKFQMTEGSTLIIENIEICDLDLRECSEVIIKNVNKNKVGELKITF